MKDVKKVCLTIAGVVALSAVVFAGDAKNGAKVYSGKCAMCHGKDGKGANCPPLNKGFDAKKWKDAIVNGKKGKKTMPGFKEKLKDAEVEDILSYLQSLKKK